MLFFICSSMADVSIMWQNYWLLEWQTIAPQIASFVFMVQLHLHCDCVLYYPYGIKMGIMALVFVSGLADGVVMWLFSTIDVIMWLAYQVMMMRHIILKKGWYVCRFNISHWLNDDNVQLWMQHRIRYYDMCLSWVDCGNNSDMYSIIAIFFDMLVDMVSIMDDIWSLFKVIYDKLFVGSVVYSSQSDVECACIFYMCIKPMLRINGFNWMMWCYVYIFHIICWLRLALHFVVVVCLL